jgi:hypothetical protein
MLPSVGDEDVAREKANYRKHVSSGDWEAQLSAAFHRSHQRFDLADIDFPQI